MLFKIIVFQLLFVKLKYQLMFKIKYNFSFYLEYIKKIEFLSIIEKNVNHKKLDLLSDTNSIL